jgi:hypothetical protein
MELREVGCGSEKWDGFGLECLMAVFGISGIEILDCISSEFVT